MKSVGSLKKTILVIIDIAAPIPAQTEYEVLIGNVLYAMNKRYIILEHRSEST